MEDIIKFLNINKFGSLATSGANKPDVRPFEFVFYCDRGMFFYTSASSELVKQLKENSNICFCATDSSYNYVKVNGTVLFSEEEDDKSKILEKSEFAKTIFKDQTLEKMIIFYLPKGNCIQHFHDNNKTITKEF
ncbi:MAG: pyridoxamine 5'-phosphate oxidase family protein [Lachnotalea sp.]